MNSIISTEFQFHLDIHGSHILNAQVFLVDNNIVQHSIDMIGQIFIDLDIGHSLLFPHDI